jgi:hypothetical protein
LIGSAVETVSLQNAGGGGYTPTNKRKFVVVIGAVSIVSRLLDLMETFLDEEEGDEAMHLVLLAPNPAAPNIKAIISQSLYKDRITYLVGDGLDPADFTRVQLESASAVYIVADRKAEEPQMEDEHNTLRAWAVNE